MPRQLSHLLQVSAQMSPPPTSPFSLSCRRESVFCPKQCQINVLNMTTLTVRVIYQVPPVYQALGRTLGTQLEAVEIYPCSCGVVGIMVWGTEGGRL